MTDLLAWRKSSWSSGENGNCVEVALTSRRAAVRDSKNPGGPTLAVRPAALRALFGSVKADRLSG